uniref:C2H2-type domain-containing protein n=1 Tax=Mola mola TaxID=94237 RepID=A0A3Q4ATE6_MOLML
MKFSSWCHFVGDNIGYRLLKFGLSRPKVKVTGSFMSFLCYVSLQSSHSNMSVRRRRFLLKQEADTFMLTPDNEENEHSEDQNLDWNPDETLDDSSVNTPVIISVVSEPTVSVHNPHCNTHTGITSITCDTCGRDFKCKSHFKKHLRSHTGEKPYSCSFCEKKFSQRSSLNIHLRIHTGEKPFICDTCGKDFSNAHLQRHLRSHTGEKPYSCSFCGKSFSQRSTVTAHCRIHTGEKPYICKTCGKGFLKCSYLTVHMRRVHTGEKPHLCKTCGKGFAVRSDMTIHMRMHTGEKPFTCATLLYDMFLSDYKGVSETFVL